MIEKKSNKNRKLIYFTCIQDNRLSLHLLLSTYKLVKFINVLQVTQATMIETFEKKEVKDFEDKMVSKQ